MAHCYILKSQKSSKYYIGSTTNLSKRIANHNARLVRSTKHDAPWQLLYSEFFDNLSEARKREQQIKKWKSRAAIERLILRIKI